jgi:hypothetical protein
LITLPDLYERHCEKLLALEPEPELEQVVIVTLPLLRVVHVVLAWAATVPASRTRAAGMAIAWFMGVKGATYPGNSQPTLRPSLDT